MSTSHRGKETDTVIMQDLTEAIPTETLPRRANGVKSTRNGKMIADKTQSKPCIYIKGELLELRSAPASQDRPTCLADEFFNMEGVWDPEAWHKSNTSRCASPIVDGKSVTFDHGKKIEMLDDTIELTPHRRSFHAGCQVQTAEFTENDKGRQRTRGILLSEGKSRLTGRAAGQRKTIEKAFIKDRDRDCGNRDRGDRDRERDREKDKDLDTSLRKGARSNRERERTYPYDKENRREYQRDRERGKDKHDLPEWMTDGPSCQTDTIELKGFDKAIEDEKNAMFNKSKKNKKSSRSNTPVNNERPKKSNKSTASADNKPKKTSKRSSPSNAPVSVVVDEKENEEQNEDEKENEKPVDTTGKSERLTPTDKLFDMNGLFNVMDYLPQHLFADEIVGEACGSKFSQWFRSRSSSHASNHSGSRPNSVPPLQDVGVNAMMADSPTMLPMSFFTPIQPAPSTGNNMVDSYHHSPSLLDIIKKQQQERNNSSKEVKGRVTLDEIEPISNIVNPGLSASTLGESVNGEVRPTPFDKLVSTMKQAGQLPEKPAPVVTGLPDHLLPKPPKRTSPTFEKLKRALSRSPSPVQPTRLSPIGHINRPVSPLLVASLGERLLTPEFFKQPVIPRAMHPLEFFNQRRGSFGSTQQQKHQPDRFEQRDRSQDIKNEGTIGDLRIPRSMTNGIPPSQSKGSGLPTAFLPTSVIRKMHNERHEQRDRPDFMNHPEIPNIGSSISAFADPQKLFQQTLRASQMPLPPDSIGSQDSLDSSHSSSRTLGPQRLFNHQNGSSLFSSPSHAQTSLVSSGFPLQSVPKSPQYRSMDSSNRFTTHSTPNTPDRGNQDPPHVHRMFDNTSSSTLKKEEEFLLDLLGKSGGSAFTNPQELSRGAGPGIDRLTRSENTHRTPVGGTVNNWPSREPARLEGFRPPIPATKTSFQSRPPFNRTRMTTDQTSNMPVGDSHYSTGGIPRTNQPRIPTSGFERPNRLPPQHQPQHQPQQSTGNNRPSLPMQGNQNLRGKFAQYPNTGPRLPVPMQPTNTSSPNISSMPNMTAAVAAHALVQQQLVQQAARAQALQAAQAAQLLQQQQQHVSVMRAQMQAALMAQAIQRGQAAQAAMMYNPNLIANNLQAVAQQMGLRAQRPPSQTKPLPTPLISRTSQSQVNGQPVVTSASDNPLTKWFGKDILQAPLQPPVDRNTKAKMLSVEELERTQRGEK